MTAIKVFLDEDVHALIADALRLRGWEALTTVEAGRQQSSDIEQIQFALENGYTIVSYNVADFPRLHYQITGGGQHHAGIIVATQDDPRINARVLLSLVSTFSAEDLRDQLLYLNNWI
jgi:predicted nuclease of predicted toxin-antitoxin system